MGRVLSAGDEVVVASVPLAGSNFFMRPDTAASAPMMKGARHKHLYNIDANADAMEHSRMPPLTYASYLDLEKLLTLQKPRSSPAEHDETLFIIIHQTYELWFKQLLHEFEKVKRDFSAGDLFGAIHSFKRTRTIMKVLVAQVDILETMTPSSFSSFRNRLETASGFQSVQFREIEFVLGYKRASTLAYLKPDFPGYDRLQQLLDERTVIDHFYDFLATRGTQIPEELKKRDFTQPNGPNEQVQQEILRLYKSAPECSILFELMTDFDEGLQEWRYRHIKLVERTIGAKKGTGGSPGVPFLKESLFKPIFHDLWAIRHEM
jgi:tryptophan 2,3-dioxygenase